jgi:hypothetical protein
VAYDSRVRQGKGTKYVLVHSNDPASPLVALGVRADLEVVLEAEPKTLDVGQLGWNEQAVRELRLAGPEVAGVRARAVSFVPEGRAMYSARPRVALRERARAGSAEAPPSYDVLIGPAPEAGRFLGTLVVETDHPHAAALHVRLSGEMLPPIVHTPSRLVLTNLAPDVVARHTIRLQPTGGEAIERLEATVDHPAMRTEVSRHGAAWHVLVLCEGGAVGPDSAEVRISTGHPRLPEIVVPVSLAR